MNWKKTFKIGGLYLTFSNCRLRKRCDNRGEGGLLKDLKGELYQEQGGVCPHCLEVYDYKQMELHHVLPYFKFEGLRADRRNMLLLCSRCHLKIHHNPYRDIELQEAKAKELGIDIREIYGY